MLATTASFGCVHVVKYVNGIAGITEKADERTDIH